MGLFETVRRPFRMGSGSYGAGKSGLVAYLPYLSFLQSVYSFNAL